MMETNEEIVQKLKQSIHDYYMGYIKQKLNYLLVKGQEAEISCQIMQFIEAQIDTGAKTIVKENIINILNSILLENNSCNNNLLENRISYCFPDAATVTIEESQVAFLEEKFQTPFNGLEEKAYYLYISPEYYDKNIKYIESEIKKLEKTFSRQDLKGFEKKFGEDLLSKQYELECAKVYESASKQIDVKRQKFNFANKKLINEYGNKYEEIIAKDIPEEEKYDLAEKLLEDTKLSDEKNRQAILRLDAEYEKLSKNFKGKIQDTNTIYKQMQNLHLFDKNRYFEDMRSSINPELSSLYKKRFLLNSYRLAHNESVYTENQNSFGNLFKIFNYKNKKAVLAIGPHFERDYAYDTSNTTKSSCIEDVDKNLIKRLAKFYGDSVLGDTTEFENTLIEYFKNNYKELTGNKTSEFLYNLSQEGTENLEDGNLFKIAKQFNIDITPFKNNFGADLIIRDGLIYEDKENTLNVIYATDKAINNMVESLYSTALYYKHLARENALASINTIALQNSFVEYAAQNNITLNNAKHSQDLKYKKRFLKKKNEQENVINFKQSC